MPETAQELAERQPELLDRLLQRLKILHARSAGEKTDEQRINEGMSSQIIGDTTQKAHRALIEQESQQLQMVASREQWSSDRLAHEISAMHQRITADMFKEHWFESTLSTPNHPIHAATYGTSMFRYDLRILMAENPSPERFREFGWIMFDVNGLRSFKDCTSHEHTTRYLQGIVHILLDPYGPTGRYLQATGIRVTPMATGGDEFVLYLRGRSPLCPALINEIIASFQREIFSSDTLRAFLNFDDERVLITYAMPSSHQRKEFAKLSPKERKKRFDAIRASLPEKFTPSIAGGGALLDEGIRRAVEKDERDLQGGDETFLSIREKIVQSTIELAEDRQKKNKERDVRRLEITDPQQHAFRLRNGENRRLQDEKRRLQELKETLETELIDTRARLEALLAKEQTRNGGTILS